jgi:methylenetetrahydrofolate reductase (NADPH)
MSVASVYQRGKKPVISLEYFPQKNEKLNDIYYTTDRLLCFEPAIFSVTCGASGGAAVGTNPTVIALNEKYGKYGIEVVAHSTLIGKSKLELQDLLLEMDAKGIRNILALRGDPSPGERFSPRPDGHKYASEYVEQIRLLNEGKHLKSNGAYGEGRKTNFCIGVAAYPDGHPECEDPIKCVEYLKIKEEMGASYAVTQMVLNIDNYLRLVDEAQKIGVKMPIIPGIMFLGNYKKYQQIVLDAIERRISRMDIPSELARKVEDSEDNDADFEKVWSEFTLSLCEKLFQKGGVPGLQLFTLNTPTYVYKVLQELFGGGKVCKVKNDMEKLFTATRLLFSKSAQGKPEEIEARKAIAADGGRLIPHLPEGLAEKAIQKYVNKLYGGSIITLVEEELKPLEVHGANLNEESPQSTYSFVAVNIKRFYEEGTLPP